MTGLKYDDGKAPWHILPWDAAESIVKVLAFGAAKYGERNWEGGIKYSRVKSALDRHIKAWWQDGADNDPETGLPHLAHAGCCVMFLLAFHLRGRKDLDNRPTSAKPLTPPILALPKTPKGPRAFDDKGQELKVGDKFDICYKDPKPKHTVKEVRKSIRGESMIIDKEGTGPWFAHSSKRAAKTRCNLIILKAT